MPNTENQTQPLSYTYDSKIISSAEIIAPGINPNQPSLALAALRQGYAFSETKDCIDAVTGNATEIYEDQAESYLLGAAALLTERRKNKLLMANTQDSVPKTGKRLNDYTEEDINKLNAEFWNSKR